MRHYILIIVSILSILVSGCGMSSKGGGGGGSFNDPPATDPNAGMESKILDIWHAPSDAYDTPADFEFTGNLDPLAAGTTYLWDFGDGTTSTEANPTHSYMYQGNFVYTLTIECKGKQDYKIATNPLGVFGGNRRPTINLVTVNPCKAYVMDMITFTAAAVDAEGDALTYTWDFGDGTTSVGSAVQHSYSSNDIFKIKLTVTDSKGASTTKKVYAGIGPGSNFPPEADTISCTPAEMKNGENVTFTVNATDYEGDVLTYEWDMGDGRKYYTASPVHKYDTIGVYKVSVTVTDTMNNSTVVTKLISVSGET